MSVLAPPSTPGRTVQERSAQARGRMEGTRGDPLFLAGWKRALFLHYEVDPELLQRAVPFALDLWEGKHAYVSLVAFTIENMRPFVGGRWTKWMLAPIGTHGFLNVRTYVQHEGESGIFFLREWLSNRLSVKLGPLAFGLPYRYGRTRYEHRPEEGILRGEVSAGKEKLRYRGTTPADGDCEVEAGSLDEFLLERYTAFTSRAPEATQRYFHVWHEPWQQQRVELEVEDDSLIRGLGDWAEGARFVGANYSPGVDEVWMGWPRKSG